MQRLAFFLPLPSSSISLLLARVPIGEFLFSFFLFLYIGGIVAKRKIVRGKRDLDDWCINRRVIYGK